MSEVVEFWTCAKCERRNSVGYYCPACGNMRSMLQPPTATRSILPEGLLKDWEIDHLCRDLVRRDIYNEGFVGRLRNHLSDVLAVPRIDAHVETLMALRNSGIDTTCGACMEVAFTDMTTNWHTCKSVTAPSLTSLLIHGESVELLPAIPGHSHSIGADGQPTCGCTFKKPQP